MAIIVNGEELSGIQAAFYVSLYALPWAYGVVAITGVFVRRIIGPVLWGFSKNVGRHLGL